MSDAPQAPVKSPIPGLKELVLGDIGTGKSTAIRSWIDAGVTPFVIFTESGYEMVNDIGCDKLHWTYIPPAAVSFATLMDNAKKINTLSYKMLCNVDDINKSRYDQFMKVITACNAFVCDRCKKPFGDVSTWGTNRAFVIDSLSGLSLMSKDLTVGAKPAPDRGEWGVMMDNLERFIHSLCFGTRCHFMLTAHTEKEPDELSGMTYTMASTLGKKLAPKVPRFFSDVIFAKRVAKDKIEWSTWEQAMSLKARHIGWDSSLPIGFKPLVEAWVKRGGIIETGA